jgi:hypothetical protein
LGVTARTQAAVVAIKNGWSKSPKFISSHESTGSLVEFLNNRPRAEERNEKRNHHRRLDRIVTGAFISMQALLSGRAGQIIGPDHYRILDESFWAVRSQDY